MSKLHVSPQDKFYKLYSQEQLTHIIKNLDLNHEILLQYGYFEKGSKYWQEYVERLLNDEYPNILLKTNELLKLNMHIVDYYVKNHKRINVYDIGSGNGVAAREFLSYLVSKKAFQVRYIAIDLSTDMLKIVERNIKQWFNGKVEFVARNRDITFERFDDNTAVGKNIMLLLGGTLDNFNIPDEILRVVHKSMDKNDLLLYTAKIDSKTSRKCLNFSPKKEVEKITALNRIVLDMLNINDSLYDVESGYDDKERQRFIQIRLKSDISIKFVFAERERIVDFNSGDAILIWRARHQTVCEVIDKFLANGFITQHFSLDASQEYMFTACTIDIKNRLGF